MAAGRPKKISRKLILNQLKQFPHIGNKKLAEYCFCSEMQMKRIIRELEKDGYLVRTVIRDDEKYRTYRFVQLTSTGYNYLGINAISPIASKETDSDVIAIRSMTFLELIGNTDLDYKEVIERMRVNG